MRSRSLALLLSVVVALALGILCSPVFAGAALQLAGVRSGADAEPLAQLAPVVRELVKERTADSEVLLLADGTKLRRIYDGAVHMKTDSGAWVDINTLLTESGAGLFSPAATPFDLVFTASAHDQAPVRLGYKGFVVTMDLLGVEEAAPGIRDSRATYAKVATATTLTYDATSDGLKETLWLESAQAPSSFTVFVSHAGLALRQDALGEWGFYASGAEQPTFVMHDLLVFDSSTDAAGDPAFCRAATMSVAPTKGGSLVTYAVPGDWLADPSRVYPVQIDPTVTIKGETNTYDTYVQYLTGEMGSSHGASAELKVGVIPYEGDSLSLLHFDLSGLKSANEYVTGASLHLRCYDRPTTGRNFVACSSKHDWSEAATWNSYVESVNGVVFSREIGEAPASTQNWMDLSCQQVTQAWVSGNEPDYGFVIDDTSANNSEFYSGRFRSSEYSNIGYIPYLNVAYASDPPHVTTLSPDKSSYRVGETVTATVNLGGAPLSEVRQVRLGINRKAEVASRYRGVMCWYEENPPDDEWVSRPHEQANGGYFAYYRNDSDGYGSRYITPLLGQCTVNADHSQLTFKFKIGENWGDVQANQLDANIVMWPGDGSAYWDTNEPYWTSGWKTLSQKFDVIPVLNEAPTARTSTPSPNDNSDWLIETDADHNGLEENTQSNDNSKGRGSVTLYWPAASAADSYAIYLWDGRSYRQVGTTTATSWSSAGKGLYPTDAQIEALADPYSANPFRTDGSGRDLRDNPNALYQKTDDPNDSFACDTWTHYSFRVVPYHGTVSAAITDNVGVAVTLDNRTRHAYEAPQRLTYRVNDLPDDRVEAVLDVGQFMPLTDDVMRLGVSATDLALSSWGPPAVLERYYDSAVTATGGYFAPGWRFSFERALDVSQSASGFISYVDEYGATATFCGSDAAWRAPNGLHARLTTSGTDYVLTFKDRSYLRFDGASSVRNLKAEGDARGNEVTYSISSSQVVITAANGRKIVLTLASGKVASAATQTASGASERTVAYGQGSAGSSPWTVTYPVSRASDGAGSLDRQRQVKYTYASATDKRLTRIDVLGLDGAGALVSTEPTRREEFIYDSDANRNRLLEVRLPDYYASPAVSDAHLTLCYEALTAASARPEIRVDRYGSLMGTSGYTIKKSLCYNPTGTLREDGRPFNSVIPYNADDRTTYAYAPDNQPTRLTSPTWRISQTVFDSRGNAIAAASNRGGGSVTSYAYDANSDGLDDVLAATYPALGAASHIYYASVTQRLVSEVKTEGIGYAPHLPDPSLPTMVSQPVHAPDAATGIDPLLAWKRCTYADQTLPGPDGANHTMKQALTVEEQATGGVPDTPVWARTEYSNFDLSGQAKRTKNVGVGYAPPDDPTKAKPASGDESYAGKSWDLVTDRTIDGFGRLLTETSPGPNGSNVQLQTNAYDLCGRPIKSVGPAVAVLGSIQQITAYDVLGREKESYACNDLAKDAQNRLIKTAWTTTSYGTTSDGAEVRVDRLIGDAAEGVLGQIQSSSTTRYDALGRQTTSSDTSVGGLPARNWYDPTGNRVGSWPEDSQTEGGSNRTTYDGQHFSSWSYNADQRVTVAHDRANSTGFVTGLTYNADGTLAKQLDPDGHWTTYTYDLAGNQATATAPSDTYNAITRPYDTVTACSVYDAQGRTISETDAGGGESYFTYDRLGRETSSFRPSSESNATVGANDTVTYSTTNGLGWKLREYSGDADGDGQSDDVDTEWTYNPDGSVNQQTVGRTATKSLTTFAYDDAGRMTKKTITPASGETRSLTYAYDFFGRLTKETRDKVLSGVATTLRETTLSYDSLGRVLGRTVKVRDLYSGVLVTAIADASSYTNNDSALGNASVTTTSSLAMAKLTNETVPNPLTETVKVDGRGRDVAYDVSLPNVGSTATWYLGRDVTARDFGDRATTVNVATTVNESPGDGVVDTDATWTYDEVGRVDVQGGLGFTIDGATYAYSAATGRRTTAAIATRIGSAINDKYAYFNDGRVKKGGNADVAKDGTYTYNRHGDMKTATLGTATRTFAYSVKHRLSWTQVDDGDRTYYRWDTNLGQRTGKAVGTKVNDVWQAPTSWKTTFSYDLSGELIGWDDQTDAGHKDKAIYTYDADGQRIRSVVTEDYNLAAASQTVTTTDYLYDGLMLRSMTITKTEGQVTNPVLKGKWQVVYLYDAQGRPYAGIDRKLSDGGTTHTFYLVTNDRGDVLELLDGDHLRFAAYRYDAYGRPTETTVRTDPSPAMTVAWAQGIAERNVLRYAGYCWDEHNDLYYLQSRYYDPITRQFMSRDPIKADGDESPYQYCSGRPVANTDPTGEMLVTGSGAGGGGDKPGSVKVDFRSLLCFPAYANYWAMCYGAIGQSPSAWQSFARIVKSPTTVKAALMKGGTNPLFFPAAFSGAVTEKYSDERFMQPYWNMHRGDENAWKWIIGLGSIAFGGAEGVLAADAAAEAATLYGPHMVGPLSRSVAATFRSGSYTERVLGEELMAYRSFGGKAGPSGAFWSRTSPAGRLQAQLDGAVNPAWGNTLIRTATARIPAGTKIYEGAAASQRLSGGGSLYGGGNQIYVPGFDPSWIVP